MRYVTNEDDAAALLNMGFLKILTNLDKHRPEVPFEAWIRRIMINTIIDEYRKDKKRKAHIEYTDFDDRTDDETFVDYNEADRRFDAEEIERVIQSLPPTSREVFNLYAIDGYSHKEIAERLNISTGTSKWHVSFARKTIKKQLSEALNSFTKLFS